MSLLKKFQDLIGAKKSAKHTLDLLAKSLEETDNQFLHYDGIHAQTIERHLHAAEALCQQAMSDGEDDEESTSSVSVRDGLVHLHIARLLLSGKEQSKIELKSTHDTVEGALNYLIQQIAKVKLLVEYGDLQISPAIQEALMSVMNIFDETVTHLKLRHVKDARREAGAALVALHWTVCLLEVNNPGHDLSELKTLASISTPAERRACELADKMAACRLELTGLQTINSPDVVLHLNEAEAKFNSSIENLIDGDSELAMVDARAGMLEVQLALRASKEAINNSERRQNQLARQQISQFKIDAHRILRLTEHLDVDFRTLSRRLDAAEESFIKAYRLLDKGELVHAERVARAAHLDLDFCWQIANARKPEYRDEL